MLNPAPAPPPGAYVLAPAELEEALRETVRISREYWGCLDTERVAVAAASEMMGRLDAAREPVSLLGRLEGER